MSTTKDGDTVRRLEEFYAKEQANTVEKPVCPQCGYASMTLFTPFKDSITANAEWSKEAKKHLKGADRIDWSKAHLYCNKDLNCTYEFPLYNGQCDD